MGWTSEVVAQDFGISKEKHDHYALLSHSRAEKVLISGLMQGALSFINNFLGDKGRVLQE